MTNDRFNPRSQRGLDLAKTKHQRFRRIADGTWLVPSAIRADQTYMIDASLSRCTCPDGETGATCEHLWAVAYLQNEITLIDGTHLEPPPVEDPEDAATSLGVQGGVS